MTPGHLLETLEHRDTTQPARPIAGILFDKDGTLIDFNKTWLPRYWAAARHISSACNRAGDAAQLMAMGGYLEQDQTWQPDSLLASGSNDQILTAWGEHLGIRIDGDLRNRSLQLFAASEQPYAAVLDDMDTFLRSLRDKNLQLGVATMDDNATAQSTLDAMQIAHYFDFVCGADSGFGLKPDPGMVRAFCDTAGLEACEVMMVGDSPRDLVMGQRAGVGLCVGVLTGAHGAESLINDAHYVVDDIASITALVENSNPPDCSHKSCNKL